MPGNNPAPVPDGLRENWQVRELVHNSQITSEFGGRAEEPAPVFAYTPNAADEDLASAPLPIEIRATNMDRTLETMLTNCHVTMQTQMAHRQSHHQRRLQPRPSRERQPGDGNPPTSEGSLHRTGRSLLNLCSAVE